MTIPGSRTFLDIDTQRDFLDPGGSLFLPGSESIRPNLAQLTRYARDHAIPVIATACAHRLDDPDPEPFPPHCLVGSKGQQRIKETDWPGSLVLGPDDRFTGDRPPPHLTIQKRKYDVFTHSDFERILGIYRETTFVIYGVATDYCVRCAAEGLLARGKPVALVADAIRPVDPQAEPAILTDLVHRGAGLTRTDLVCA